MSSAMSGMVNQTSAYVAGGVVPFRMGNSHPSLFPYEPLPTGDGELIVTAGQRHPVPQAVRGDRGARSWPQDPRFATNQGRTANRDELRPLLAEQLAAKTAGEWFDELIAVGRALRADQHRGRGHRVRGRGSAWSRSSRPGPADRTRPGVRHPLTFSRHPAALPPPAAGARRARRRDPGLARPTPEPTTEDSTA